MADTISYQYAALSALQRAADQDELCLAKYSEIEKKDAPCFFGGSWRNLIWRHAASSLCPT